MSGCPKSPGEARPPTWHQQRALMCLQVLGMQDELARVKQAANADTRRLAVEVGALRSDSDSLRKELQHAGAALEQRSTTLSVSQVTQAAELVHGRASLQWPAMSLTLAS